MKRRLNLSFFWHMHQPDYRDSDGVMKMPWVFLHAIKDYYDMPWILSKYPGLKATFNLTPPLIEQLKLYDNPVENDYFLSLWSQHPSKLSSQKKKWVIKTCKSCNYDTMVEPMARYRELYHHDSMDDLQIIDLEVQFMLAWCGNYLRQNNHVIQQLIHKGRLYSQDDKSELLSTLSDFVLSILPYYASLLDNGTISLSTTPYNHPILPLLIDMKNAEIANEYTKLPNNPISLKDDAYEQVRRSAELYEETFGLKPSGFWPAEGAVDELSLNIYKKLGIKWIATDEAILFKSLQNSDRNSLYSIYDFNGLAIGFRDHGLSDLIGFDYRFKDHNDAVDHFMEAMKPIASSETNKTAFVILDGENAWEYYKENGYPFFSTLYQRLSESKWCKTVTMDEVSDYKKTILDNLSPGSWINGDFSTWVGHYEKNRAWELLFQTRRDVDNYDGKIDEDIAEKIKFHFLAAECSDWYWWYGDDHVTDFALEFDALFRQHLIEIYKLLDIYPPADLLEAIIKNRSTASFMVRPQMPIRPHIEGKTSSFFEWIGCGSIDESRLFSSMDRKRGPISRIKYGQNEEAVYIAFEGDVAPLSETDCILKITIEELSKNYSLDLSEADSHSEIIYAVNETIEIMLPLDLFGGLKTVHLRFEIVDGKSIVQTLPGYGALEIMLDEDYSRSWFI